jgi:hypothetical protein
MHVFPHDEPFIVPPEVRCCSNDSLAFLAFWCGESGWSFLKRRAFVIGEFVESREFIFIGPEDPLP